MISELGERLYRKFEHQPESAVEVIDHESQGDEFKTFTYTPENPVSDVPIVYAWGFATNNYVVSEFADSMAAQGRKVIVVDEPSRAQATDNNGEGYKFIARNTDFLEAAVEDLGYDKVDIVAHSQGSIISRLYARRNPDAVRSIVEIAPAGQDAKGGKLRQNIGGLIEGLRMAGKVFRKSTIRGIGRQLVHNTVNIKNSLGQQAEIAGSDERPSNLELRKRGVEIGLIAMHADAVFKPHHLIGEDSVDRVNEEMGRYGSVVSFRRPMATHNEMFDNPVETAIAVDQMLASLNGEESLIQKVELTKAEIKRNNLRIRVATFMRKILSKKREYYY